MHNEEPDNGAAITTPALGQQSFEISPDCVKLLDVDGRVARSIAGTPPLHVAQRLDWRSAASDRTLNRGCMLELR
jgi:hypothetical protein